jgi:4-aminobutyrate aminotransferase-like enzyme
MRVCPPLITTKEQVMEACEIIVKSIDESNK